jgi:hypothetical protein
MMHSALDDCPQCGQGFKTCRANIRGLHEHTCPSGHTWSANRLDELKSTRFFGDGGLPTV